MPETNQTAPAVIAESLNLLAAAAGLITDTNRHASTPCADWTVTQVLQHAAGDQLAWAAALGVGSGPSANPFAPSGQLDGSVRELITPALAAARTAWAQLSPNAGPSDGPGNGNGNSSGQATDQAPGEATVPTPLPQGELPVSVAAAACALDAAVHGWEIAVALGRPGRFLPDPLAGQLLAARTIIEPLRQFGAYAAALSPQPGDGHAAELLRYLGRDPRWQPIFDNSKDV
jgi:hypothetical protein